MRKANVKKMRLPSLNEYHEHSKSILTVDAVSFTGCWTDTPHPSLQNEICVIKREREFSMDYLTLESRRPYERGAVVPVIELEGEEPVGSFLSHLGHEWVVIAPSLAMCVRKIADIEYRADKGAEDAALYESSDAKAMIDAWQARAGFLDEQDTVVFKRFKDSPLYHHIKEVKLLSVEQFRDFMDKGTGIKPVCPDDFEELWWLSNNGAANSRFGAYAANSFGDCEEDDIYNTPVRQHGHDCGRQF